jgi:hypothetical protein
MLSVRLILYYKNFQSRKEPLNRFAPQVSCFYFFGYDCFLYTEKVALP